MKTQGMKHQLRALREMNGREYFALFMEQGTGKTWTFLADAERLYAAGQIEGVLVIAPKGVHTNWIRREIPTHVSAPAIAMAWRSGAGKRERAKLEKLFTPRDDGEQPPLRVFAINIDALTTKDGFAFATRFLSSIKSMIIIDESSRIKNPKGARTERVMALRPLVKWARIGSGLPITNSPPDVFSQMEFLQSGLLETTSHRAFVAEYSQLMDPRHPMMRKMIQKNPRLAFAQIVERDPVTGHPMYRNLDKLSALISKHSFRVLKSECLDLPPKIYKNVYFDLDAAQQRAYELMAKEYRVVLEDGTIEPVAKLNSVIKLQQITSGFVIQKNDEPLYITKDNPRLATLRETLNDYPGKVIIWAHFREELRAIAEMLSEDYKVVQYHGGVGTEDRERAVDDFQNGDADIFLGQPQSGGIGLTLTAAQTVIYFSNSYNLETRGQSEDRAHRIGTKGHVVYVDIVASGTIDEQITSALQRKENLAASILNVSSSLAQEISAQ